MLFLLACTGTPPSSPPGDDATPTSGETTPEETTDAPLVADVAAVTVEGDEGAYVFWVAVLSPDVDCNRYADWWEVLTPKGGLVFRRILDHSHPDEQPFTRDGSPVPVLATDEILVRAHLHPNGYGGQVLRGSVGQGFSVATDLTADFAVGLETEPPLPKKCLF